MSQHEYGVELGAKPDELKRISLAFRAGEQKERDRIKNLIVELSDSKTHSNDRLGLLVWSRTLITLFGLDESATKVV